MTELNKSDDIAKVILQWHMKNSRSEWSRGQAAIGLLLMGEEIIWSDLSEILYKRDRESFVAAFFLGQLGKQRLLSLPGINKLDDNGKKEIVSLIQKNIHDGGNRYDANRFMKQFCNILITSLE